MDDSRLPHPQAHPLAHAVLSRRKALAAGGGTFGVGSLLAACGADDATTGSAPETSTSSSSASSSSASESAGGAAALTAVSDVPVGSAVVVTAESGAAVVVAQPTAGDIVAFSGLCTHQGCAIALAATTELDCPCHGSKFDALTGAVLQGPATDPLTPFEVTVDGDSVLPAT